MPRRKLDEEFEISDELYSELPYSASDIQDYFEYITKKHEYPTENPRIQIYINETENIVTLEIKWRILSSDLNAWNYEDNWKQWRNVP